MLSKHSQPDIHSADSHVLAFDSDSLVNRLSTNAPSMSKFRCSKPSDNHEAERREGYPTLCGFHTDA